MRSITRATLALIILLSSSLAFAGPRLTVKASKVSKVGASLTVNKDELVSLQISYEAGSSIAIFCVPKMAYVTPSTKSEITFYASESVVFMIAAFKDGEVTKQEFIVIVGENPNPPNPPGPGPTPPPTPDIPTSVIGKAAYNTATKVTSATKSTDLDIIIAEVNKIKPQIAAGTLSDPKAIATALVTAMLVKLPDSSKKAWASAIATHLAPAIVSTIKDKASGQIAIDEIVKGLTAAKESKGKFSLLVH